jgi:hypothetical protein
MPYSFGGFTHQTFQVSKYPVTTLILELGKLRIKKRIVIHNSYDAAKWLNVYSEKVNST